MADVPKIKMTKAEFMALPETNTPTELINGELIVSPTPVDRHQEIVGLLHILLHRLFHSGTLRLSPADVHISEEDTVQPDLFWVSDASTTCVLADGKYWHGAPDLVVEVLSPSTQKRDRGIKFDLYEQHGTREYWLIDPDNQTVEVYRRETDHLRRIGLFDQAQMFAFGLLPDVTIPVGEIFK